MKSLFLLILITLLSMSASFADDNQGSMPTSNDSHMNLPQDQASQSEVDQVLNSDQGPPPPSQVPPSETPQPQEQGVSDSSPHVQSN